MFRERRLVSMPCVFDDTNVGAYHDCICVDFQGAKSGVDCDTAQ